MLWMVTVLSLVCLPMLETMMMMMEGEVGWKQADCCPLVRDR